MSFDPASVPSPASPRSKNRSLFAKFTAPFSNRNRNISEFYVQPDDPWKTYSPGDVVKGSVVVTVVKPLRITHLVVCLHGYVKVFKNPVASGDGAEDSGFLGTGRGRRGGEYLGNGFASLFEDEAVLCGDGRLKEGVYKFNFELEFPQQNLPTSINFERGTISYMITSTLTRPTTISPTMTCDKRITLIEDVDIAPLPVPKPRVISLEPVPKKPKNKSRVKSVSGEQLHVVPSRDSSVNGVASNDRPALSPVPSEVSGSSCVSNSTQSFQIATDLNSANNTSARNSEVQSTSTGSSDKTITATTELLRAGALPGDTIPLKISINHTKPLRSPHAIIVTLYRQGRIDTHPAIPVGTPEKGKKPIYEDYYPKSRTGLGGLNFGATKSSTAFRKDLSQTFAPLVVDPTSMTAVVRTSVRIPEDSFPTITRVPGAMINFRYYIEVVIDLRGKVAGQDRFLPRLNMMSMTNNYSPSGQVVNVADKGRTPITSTWAGNILNTDQIRREKGVVACMFEIVVGSKDTGRGQRLSSDETSPDNPPTLAQPMQPSREDWQYEEQMYQQHLRFEDQEHVLHDQYEFHHQDSSWASYPGQHTPVSPSRFIPPPQPEENVDEKTRLRMAEETLLPSRPPGDHSHAGPSEPTAPRPSAPPDPELPNGGPPYEYFPNAVGGEPCASRVLTSALSVDTIVPEPSNAQPGPSSPSTLRYNDQNSPQDDKQELERQRLMDQASAPPDSESDNMSQTNGPDVAPTATAPTLPEEDHYNNILDHQPMGSSEPLPQYQR